ncbi:MAG TPA: PQQ-binding-like beta-propeller repeat protein, partial [Tepidisphaeraceae bacterium]|nr:PQQ-binding-like beta-propeller repeat protein [Tepidisphaeraceae bacterium]
MRRIYIGLLILITSTIASADWPMLAHDPARSGCTADEIRPPFERKWYRLFADEGLMAGVQPVIADGKVFIGTMRGTLRAIDAETGKDLWTFRAGGAILHACAVADGKVFFGAADGGIYAINAANGAREWKVPTPLAIWNSPVVHHGSVIIGGRDGFLWAIDVKTGDVKWKGKTDGPILCSPAIDVKLNRVYVGAEDMHVYAFDIALG